MNYATWLLAAALVLPVMRVARATVPRDAAVEIGYLLQWVEDSKCEFYRNGKWYDGRQAKAHLRDKYEYFAARNLIASTDDFIDKAATRSGLSGQDYRIRCANGVAVLSGQWFHEALRDYRARMNRTGAIYGGPVARVLSSG